MSDVDVRRWPSHERTRVAYQQGWNDAIHAARAWAGLWAWLTFSNDRFVLDGTRFQGPSPNAWIVFHDAATGAQTLDLTGATVTWHRSA